MKQLILFIFLIVCFNVSGQSKLKSIFKKKEPDSVYCSAKFVSMTLVCEFNWSIFSNNRCSTNMGLIIGSCSKMKSFTITQDEEQKNSFLQFKNFIDTTLPISKDKKSLVAIFAKIQESIKSKNFEQYSKNSKAYIKLLKKFDDEYKEKINNFLKS